MSRNKNGIGAKIRRARVEMGLTQEELAARAGVGRSTLSNYESGRIRPTAEALSRIASVLGKTVDWFVGAKEQKDALEEVLERVKRLEGFLSSAFCSGHRSVPLLGSVPASGWDSQPDIDSFRHVVLPPDIDADYALIVEGDSMHPEIQKKDVVFVRRTHDLRDNAVVVAVNEHNETTLKRLIRQANRWVLKADNPDYTVVPSKRAKVVGVVVGLFRRL